MGASAGSSVALRAPLAPHYGLIACGASLHWMDPDAALRRFREAGPGAVVAITDTQNVHGPYHDDVLRVSRAYSEIEHHRETVDLVEDLVAAGRFRVEGQERTPPMPFEQSVGDYIEFLHSTSTLAPIRLGDRSREFDDAIRAVFARHRIARLRYGVVGLITWGQPREKR